MSYALCTLLAESHAALELAPEAIWSMVQGGVDERDGAALRSRCSPCGSLRLLHAVGPAAEGSGVVPGEQRTTCICACLHTMCIMPVCSCRSATAAIVNDMAYVRLCRHQLTRSWQCTDGPASCCFLCWQMALSQQATSCRQVEHAMCTTALSSENTVGHV